MAKDHGHRLQMYAYNRITEKVGGEFSRHLNEWKIHTNTLIQYAGHAVDAFQTHFTRVKEEIAAERQRNEQLAMWALALISGPALSFVSGALQHRLGPKLFGDRAKAIRTTPNPKYVPHPSKPPSAPTAPKLDQPTPNRPFSTHQKHQVTKAEKEKLRAERNARGYKEQQDARDGAVQRITPGKPVPKKLSHDVFDPDWSKTKGKILGDLGSSLISSFMVLPSIKAKPPDRTNLENAINRVPDAKNLADLNSYLDNVWLQAQTVGKDAIEKFADTILEDNTWGDRLWTKLLNGQLMGVRRVFGEEATFNVGKEWIRALIDQQREAWAKQDNPVHQEGWFYYGNKPVDPVERHFVHAVETELWAKWIDLEDFQHERVTEYGSIDREGNIEEKGSYDSYENPMGHSGIALNRILPRLRQLGIVPPGPSTLRGINPPPMAVEIRGVVDNVDTKAELESINKWAENRKPVIFGGQLNSVRRIMGKLPVSGAD